MPHYLLRCVLVVAALLIGASAGLAHAQVPLLVPATRFYGTATVNGVPATIGSTVTAQSLASGATCGTGSVADTSGSYSIDVRASFDCLGGFSFVINGQAADELGTLPSVQGTPVQLNLTLSTAPVFSLTYPSGWNLIAWPAGSQISGAGGPLYTWQPGDSSYEVLSAGILTSTGMGYWANFPTTTTEALPYSAKLHMSRYLPAGQYVMIGDPSNWPATVIGADSVYTYDPVSGYQRTTVLRPGQGAWALSHFGATVTITSTGP